MRILVVGATGTIGKAVVAALQEHEIVPVSHKSTDITVDIADPASIRAMYARVGRIDAVVSAAGGGKFAAFGEPSDDDFTFSIANKLMGQVNLVRFGVEHVNDNGSITITSGVLARSPMPGSRAVSLVNAGLEGFGRSAALEAGRGIRVNIVSPPWVTETMHALGMSGFENLSAATVAKAYVRSVSGDENGTVIDP